MLSRLFRRLFLQHLEKAFDAGKLQFFTDLQRLNECNAFRRYLVPLRKAEWVVGKPPFAGPEQVLDYVLKPMLSRVRVPPRSSWSHRLQRD